MRVEGYRKFCNKLWNATKFAMMKFPEGFVPAKSAEPTGKETLVEQWILSRLSQTAGELNRYLEQRNFQMATTTIYDFWLYQLCDVYIEAMKPLSAEDAPEDVRRSAQDTLYTALDYGLKMLHPFMPFVTEELWQRLPRRPEDKTISIALASFPQKVSFLIHCEVHPLGITDIIMNHRTRRCRRTRSSKILPLSTSAPRRSDRWPVYTTSALAYKVGVSV